MKKQRLVIPNEANKLIHLLLRGRNEEKAILEKSFKLLFWNIVKIMIIAIGCLIMIGFASYLLPYGL